MKKTILLIDDDSDICKLITRFLNRNGYHVVEAYTGEKGIEKFKEHSFDMVICDYQLGDKTGSEVLQEIKSIKPNILFVMITGFSDIKKAVDIIKAGAYDYITKPFVPDELLNILNAATKDIPKSNGSAEVIKTDYNKFFDTNFLVSRTQETKNMYQQL